MGLLFPPSIIGGSIVGYIIIIFSFDLSLSFLPFFLPFFLVVIIIVIIVMVCFNINGTEVYSFESRRGTGVYDLPGFFGREGRGNRGGCGHVNCRVL